MTPDRWTHTFSPPPPGNLPCAADGPEPPAVAQGKLPGEGGEWLLSNGTGAYGAGTAWGVNTRRYHGLLIAASCPPVGRVMALNQVLDQLVLNTTDRDHRSINQTVEFTSLLFPAPHDGPPCLVPDGCSRLTRFDKGLSVRWTYAWGPVRFERELLLHWQAQAATLRYRVTGLDQLPPGAALRATLRLGPMVSLRDFHGLTRRDTAGPITVDPRTGAHGPVVTAAHGETQVTLSCSAGVFKPPSDWWYNLHYPIDGRRGQGDLEDVFVPGWFEVPLDPKNDHAVILTAALGGQPAAPIHDTAARRAVLGPIVSHLRAETGLGDDPALTETLAQAADDFVVERTIGGQKLSTILAGYPWFADWGRDTFIALPGLLLCAGRFDQARATLRLFAGAIGTGKHAGLVPNRFDDYDDNAAHYNTVDGSLWFIRAAMQYVEASGDRAAWDGWLAAACVRIVEAYAAGTGYGIHMDDDGLILAGGPDTQLTWMDAAARDGDGRLVVFTPRPGKAVEINGLWYHALAGLGATLPKAFEPARRRCLALADRVAASFPKVFWNTQAGCCFDHIAPQAGGSGVGADPSIRPNQVIAAALPHSPLSKTQRRQIVDVVARTLLTPAGLRTLPVDDPDYHGVYAGPPFERDGAYHRGTIWPWLIGPYAEAVLRAGGFDDAAKAQALAAIQPLEAFVMGPGLGQLYEIHQGDLIDGTHPPRGCFAQAWSVAELIRVRRLIHAGGTGG